MAFNGQIIPLHASRCDIEPRQMLALLTMTIPNIRQPFSAKGNVAAKAFARICLSRGDDDLLYHGVRPHPHLQQVRGGNA